ncbi:MAG: TetR/AcrR family transcriptional regulator [Burkholderiaceae bacterium]|nr:TetR/AcrR family transcriptional regulator [Burkholderiaceae bacterium]
MDCSINKIKGRWERRKEARPQELLAAALDLLVERGYATTRLDDVAAKAGVSKGTLYLYFANKEELFKAVVREHIVPAIGRAEQTIEQYQGSSRNLLQEILLGRWEQVGNTKLSGIMKLIVAESGNFPEIAKFYHDEVILRGNALITKAIQRGVESGEFHQIDAVQATQVIAAPIIMLILRKHSFDTCGSEPISPDTYLETFLNLLFQGLVVRPA